MTEEAKSDAARPGLVVPWGWLSLVLTIVVVASLGTLAVIAKKQSADSLSTIALALAILSFSAQLIIVLAQAYNNNLLLAQADRVNSETRSSLTEIRATNSALLSNQSGQFSEVLRAALKTAVPAAVGDVEQAEGEDGSGGSTSEDLEERLLIRLNEAIVQARPSAPTVTAPPAPTPLPMYEQLRTFPSEERGRELLGILNNLSPRASAIFGRSVTMIRDKARLGQRPYITVSGRPDDSPAYQALAQADLITTSRVANSPDGNQRYRAALTDLGIEVGSLLLGAPPAPEWLKSEP